MKRPNINSEVEQMIRENWRVTLGEVAGELKLSHGSENHIVYNVLQYRISKRLTLDLNECREDVCERLLRHFKTDGDDFSTTFGHWRRLLSTLRLAKDKASQKGVVIFFLAETKEVPYNSFGRKIDASALQGLERRNL